MADTPCDKEAVDLNTIASAVASLRGAYQHSRYHEVADRIPALVVAAQMAMHYSPVGYERERAAALLAATYQVTSGVLLKLDDPALAAVAADRSYQTAKAAGHRLVSASSARTQVHSLLATRHPQAAVTLAKRVAQQLESESPTETTLSVRGALLLRAATAAARSEDHHDATDFLDEADTLARRLGHDANFAWTAFGPTNVALHRELAEWGTAGIAQPRSRLLSLAGVDRACHFIAGPRTRH